MHTNRLVVAVLILVSLGFVSVQAEVPNVINYQGTIKDADGMLLTGNHNLDFNIYNAESGGDLQWSEFHFGASFEDGVFNVILGETEAFGNLFDQPNLWIGVQVDGDDEMTPRMRFTSTPYAMKASVADVALTGGFDLPYSGSCSDGGDFAMTIINTATAGSGLNVHCPTTDLSTLDNFAGYFQNDAPGGRGVKGHTTANNSRAVEGVAYGEGAGTNHGGYFQAFSQSGRAVYGWATNAGASVTNYGGYFTSSGGNGRGVYAKALGVDGQAIFAEAVGDDGIGIHAKGPLRAGWFEGDIEATQRVWCASLISSGGVTCEILEITGGADLSESFDLVASDLIQPGMVVSIDRKATGQLKVADREYDRCVAGIVSGANGVKPGMIMGQEGTEADGDYPVALTGRVYCLADASYGSIQAGDLLTTSNTPGHVMKVSDHDRANGAVIGKAMNDLKDGQGYILVLVALQ